VLWDLGFVHSTSKALYKVGGTIELQRVGVTDVKFADTGAYSSPGAVHITNASGVVNGLVADNDSSPALLVEGPAARIKSFGLVVSHSVPVVPVTNDLQSVAAVELRDGAAMMGMLWQITGNQVFGIAVTTNASLFLDHGEVSGTVQARATSARTIWWSPATASWKLTTLCPAAPVAPAKQRLWPGQPIHRHVSRRPEGRTALRRCR
jgi:hypothetical protein